MTDSSFYQILGVTTAASADEIKSAYRELVKKYHPDLFHTPDAKAKATEKLRLINEAYAVLGNPKRRHRYDQRFIHREKENTRARAERRETPRSRQYEGLRNKIKKINILKHGLHFSKKQTAYTVVATVLMLIVIYASRSEPRFVVAYTLFEKLEVSSSKSASASEVGGKGWSAVGQYASVAECAESLKERVRIDEQQGSRAVFGDPNGTTMAITVLVTKESEHDRENSIPAKPDRSAANESASEPEQQPTEGKSESAENRMTKRVRNLECRATQRLVSESWLRQRFR